jgi:hypothetical protein
MAWPLRLLVDDDGSWGRPKFCWTVQHHCNFSQQTILEKCSLFLGSKILRPDDPFLEDFRSNVTN